MWVGQRGGEGVYGPLHVSTDLLPFFLSPDSWSFMHATLFYCAVYKMRVPVLADVWVPAALALRVFTPRGSTQYQRVGRHVGKLFDSVPCWSGLLLAGTGTGQSATLSP